MSDITLIACCHCTFASFTYTIPRFALPLKASLCHCDSCRYASGQIFVTFAVMPSSIPRPDFSHLDSYASSPLLTRYSCPKCGAYVGNIEPDEWEFATGMLNTTEGILDRVQMWIEDTKDGGASIWLKKGHGTNPVRHLRDRTSAEATDLIIEEMHQNSKQPSPSSRSASQKAACHCGAVSFTLQPRPPPSSPSTEPHPAYPAFLDACTSCRLTSGFEITAWLRTPRSHVLDPSTNDPYPLIPSNPRLLHYSSSKGVHRYSCRKCTASAFYVSDARDGSVDVAVGLLRGEGGVRADGDADADGGGFRWVEWKRGPQFGEEAMDKVLVKALGEGMSYLRVEEED